MGTLERADVVRISTGERKGDLLNVERVSLKQWLEFQSQFGVTGLALYVPEREAKAQPIRDRIAALQKQLEDAEDYLLHLYREN